MSRTQLRRTVHGLQRVLRDTDGGSSLVERFDELAKLVLVKVECELSPGLAAAADFTGPGSDAELARRVRGAFAEVVAKRPSLFPVRFSSIGLRDTALARAARVLGVVTLGAQREHLAGLLFEEVVRDTFEQGDNQQFFTPPSIAEFVIEFLAEQVRGRVADPACGTGGFLTAAAMRLLTAPNSVREHATLWGLELDARLAWAAGVNLHVHGAPDFQVVHVEGAGSLSDTARSQVAPLDLIVTNPPFGSDLTDREVLEGFELGKGRKARRRGVLFIEQCLRMLAPGGILAMIIDDGVLNAPSNADVRAHLLSRATPFAVVSLPEVTFMPYATVKTSVLFAQTHGGSQRRMLSPKGTFFANAERVGRKPNGDPAYRYDSSARTPVLESDLPDILRAWREPSSSSESAFWSRVPTVHDETFARAHHRLDAAFHHPARAGASRVLSASPHPLSTLHELCEVRTETILPVKDCPDDELTYVGLSNIEAHTGAAAPVVVAGATLKSHVRRFRGGDVLFAKLRPELRKAALAASDVVEGVCSAECLVLVPNASGKRVMLPELLAHLLRSDLVYGQLVHLVTGIGRPRLRPADVLAVRLPLPPLSEQRALLAELTRAEAASRALLRESEAARAMALQLRADALQRVSQRMLERKARLEELIP